MAENGGKAPCLGDAASINSLVDSINSERDKLARSEIGARESLIAKARKLISNLETPFESMQWISVAEPARAMASRVALDLKLYQTLTEDGGRSKTIEELAKPTGASPVLVSRIARMLSAVEMIKETGPSLYAPNHMTYVLAQPKYGESSRFCYDSAMLSFFHMPEFLKKTKYANPDNPKDGPFRYAYKSPDPFTWLSANPQILGSFFTYLHAQREDHPYWTDSDFYPIRERLIQGLEGDSKADTSALVDVGGGNGYVLEDIRTCVPEFTGRLILQELASVVEHVNSTGNDPRIEMMVHDFFSPQPIKGARAYFMRHVLHDYNDSSALKILAHLKEAMKPGYSKILLNECILADQGAAWQHVSLDMFMLGMNTSQERTEQEWRGLIRAAGLEITSIWSKGTGSEGLIELVLPGQH